MKKPRFLYQFGLKEFKEFGTMRALRIMLLSMILAETLVHGIAERFLAYFGVHSSLWAGFLDALVLFTILAPVYFHLMKRLDRACQAAAENVEEQFSRLLDNLNAFAYSVSYNESTLSWTPVYIGGAVANATGCGPSEFAGNDQLWFSLLHPDDKPKFLDSRRQMVETRKPAACLYRLRQKHSKDYRWVEDRAIPQLDESGKIVGILGIVRDETNWTQAEQLRTTLSMAVEQAAESILITDPAGT